MSRITPLLLACLVLAMGCENKPPPSGPRDHAGSPFVLILAPSGDDANDGQSLATPILTLSRAQELLREHVPSRDRTVEIRIAPGIYQDQTIRWDFTMPRHEVRFMPLSDDKNRPIFDGSNVGGTWFYLDADSGQTTNLVFRYIRVQHYGTAIDFHGNRDAAHLGNSHNTIYGCYFESIGNASNWTWGASTAGLRLVNSDDNEIVNSHFVDIGNYDEPELIHAIYVAHLSCRNQILRNRFLRVTGDPIRVRDFSNYNLIKENVFVRAGIKAAWTEWFCDHDRRHNQCTKPTAECPSWMNQVLNNCVSTAFDGSPLHIWDLLVDNPSPDGCGRPPGDGVYRVRCSGNTYSSK